MALTRGRINRHVSFIVIALVAGAVGACKGDRASSPGKFVPYVEITDITFRPDGAGKSLGGHTLCQVRDESIRKLWNKQSPHFEGPVWKDVAPNAEHRSIIIGVSSKERLVLDSRHPFADAATLSTDPVEVDRRAAFDAIASACVGAQKTKDSHKHMFDKWIFIPPVITFFGMLLGYFRKNWEDEKTREAYDVAVRVSRWAGAIAMAAMVGFGLMTLNLESRGAVFVLIGAVLWIPALGIAFCWFTRPVIYLCAYLYYRWANADA